MKLVFVGLVLFASSWLVGRLTCWIAGRSEFGVLGTTALGAFGGALGGLLPGPGRSGLHLLGAVLVPGNRGRLVGVRWIEGLLPGDGMSFS